MPIRPLLRWFLLPRLLRGDSPSGIKTAKVYLPADNLDDVAEVAALAECVTRFSNHHGKLYAHPGFGQLSREMFERFHAAHAAHHLSFLESVQK